MVTYLYNGNKLSINEVLGISNKAIAASVSTDDHYIRFINEGADFLDKVLSETGGIYGVTTGYGDSCDKTVDPEKYYQLPINLTRFHGCGLGRYFDKETTRAIIAVRLQSLSLGKSGVSYKLLEGLANLLKHDILPLIPEEGSVGASGDLTPLSYIAGTLIGERQVLYKDKEMSAKEAFALAKIDHVRLRPKEGLAIMNGTAVMTAVASLAMKRAENLAKICIRLTSMASLSLKGNMYHFDEKLFAVKPHAGQNYVAKMIRYDLSAKEESNIIPHRLQDPYSIRCAPHIIGVFYDMKDTFTQIIENEINSSNDNPIIDPVSKSIMHGGHFYGGHIAFVMDSLKNIIGNLCDLMDRQLALLVDEKFNRGLPPNLSGSTESYAFNHGFKAVQIGVSSWTAEALKNTMPASVFSRSTECHNQDKVSMGTIAARDCIRSLELAEQVASACLLAGVQAIELRTKQGELNTLATAHVADTLNLVRSISKPLESDRPLETDLRELCNSIRSGKFTIHYE